MKNSDTSIINQQACEWIAKLHEADLCDSEHAELKAWMSQSENHKTELRRMAERWDELNALTSLAVPLEQSKPEKQRTGYFSTAKWQVGIASVAAIALLAVWLWPYGSTDLKTNQEQPFYSTQIGEQRLITLPDNTTVLLNTNSQFSIIYTPDYRDVYLIQGEAHFEVQSNTERPFRVFAGKSKVRAVGTAFSVYLKRATVDVTVTHGSVEIDSIRDNLTDITPSADTDNNADTRMIVSAGQAAEINQLAGTIETITLPDSSYVPAWHNGKLKFTGEPLDQVVEEISRYSPLAIVIIDSELSNLRIGGLFDMGETDKMFEALENGFGVKVEYINDNLVHLTSLDTK